jgi:hypothetical protein
VAISLSELVVYSLFNLAIAVRQLIRVGLVPRLDWQPAMDLSLCLFCTVYQCCAWLGGPFDHAWGSSRLPALVQRC